MRAPLSLVLSVTLASVASACGGSDRCAIDSDCVDPFQVCVEQACVDRQRPDAGRPSMDAGEPPADAGRDAGRDAGPADADVDVDGGGYVFPDLPLAQVRDPGGELVPADFSCLGMNTAPVAGDEAAIPLSLSDLATGAALPETAVQIFSNNIVAEGDDCDVEGCVEVTTDALGATSANLAQDAWFAYRVLADETSNARTLGYNRAADAAGVGLISVSPATLGAFPSRQEETAVVVGTAVDCMGRPVVGVVLRVFGSDGTERVPGLGAADPRFFYFGADELPDLAAEYTSASGLFGGVNLPPATEPVRLEVWGLLGEGEPQKLGCEQVRADADTVSIVAVGPTRADGC